MSAVDWTGEQLTEQETSRLKQNGSCAQTLRLRFSEKRLRLSKKLELTEMLELTEKLELTENQELTENVSCAEIAAQLHEEVISKDGISRPAGIKVQRVG